MRVDAEADLLVALEALKNSVYDLKYNLESLESTISHTSMVIGIND